MAVDRQRLAPPLHCVVSDPAFKEHRNAVCETKTGQSDQSNADGRVATARNTVCTHDEPPPRASQQLAP